MKQLNSIFWLVTMISQATSVYAQLPFGQTDNCDDFDAATFVHTVDRSTPHNWDWRDASSANWTAYLPSKTKNLPSPFNPPSPTLEKNVAHLQFGIYDYEPTDGWELLFRAFGIPGAEIASPTLILYNRYKGIMRIFIWAEFDNGLPTQAALSVQFSDAHQKGSALLGLVTNPTSALEGFDVNLVSMTPNDWDIAQGDGTWLFSDLPTVYDPCTCEQSINSTSILSDNISEIGVGGRLITAQQLTLSGTTQPQTSSNMSKDDEESTNFSYKDGIEAVDNASKFLKSSTALIETIQKAQKENADDTRDTISVQATTTVDKPDAPADQEAKSLNEFKIPGFMKVIPQIGPWLTLADALITGGKKENTANTSQAVAITQTEYSGQLLLDASLKGVSFYTPGSEFENLGNWNTSKEPVYDHILGIFNLVEKPVLEFATYQPESLSPQDYAINLANSPTTYFIFPPINQYKLKPLKYVVNPASELELIDLDIAIQYRLEINNLDTTFKVNNGNFELGLIGPVAVGAELGKSVYDDLSFVERLRHYGLDIGFWQQANGGKSNEIRKITFTTGFFPAQCENMQSVLIAIPNSSTLNFDSINLTPIFSLKVRAILRRTDSDATSATEDVIFMATYDMETLSIAEGGTYLVTSTPSPQGPTGIHAYLPSYLRDYTVTGFTSSKGNQAYFPLGNNGLPFDLTLENETVNTGTFEALSSISVFNSDLIHTPTAVACDTIGGQIICGNVSQDPIVLRARNLISIDPDGLASSDIGPGTTMIMELPARFNGCDADPMPSAATYAEIQAICQDGNKYNPVIASRQEAADSTIVEKLPTIPLTAQPNPFTDELTLAYELPAEAQVQMQLVDMMGRPVRPILPTSHRKAGQHEMSVDLSDLAVGMYTVILQVGEMRQTVKVVKR